MSNNRNRGELAILLTDSQVLVQRKHIDIEDDTKGINRPLEWRELGKQLRSVSNICRPKLVSFDEKLPQILDDGFSRTRLQRQVQHLEHTSHGVSRWPSSSLLIWTCDGSQCSCAGHQLALSCRWLCMPQQSVSLFQLFLQAGHQVSS